MTTTTVLVNMPASATDVAVNFLDQTKLLRRSEKVSPDGLTINAEYVYNDGDPTRETIVITRSQIDPKANILYNSIRLQTVQTVADDDDVVIEEAPISVQLSWNTPGRSEDIAKVMSMIGTAYSLTFNGVTAKVPNTGTLSAMNRSLPGQLF